MSVALCILAILILGGAGAAMALPRLIHCALALALSMVGLAGLYLHLNAQFVGFAQVLVYIGAVAILIVFAILLTGGDGTAEVGRFYGSWRVGVGIAIGVLGVLGLAVLSSRVLVGQAVPVPEAQVREIGDLLMTDYVLALEVIGLLLTAALLGAVILSMPSASARSGTGTHPAKDHDA